LPAIGYRGKRRSRTFPSPILQPVARLLTSQQCYSQWDRVSREYVADSLAQEWLALESSEQTLAQCQIQGSGREVKPLNETILLGHRCVVAFAR
jgi:hypothetical protein